MTHIASYKHMDGEDWLDMPNSNLSINYMFQGKRVEFDDDKVGKTVDPNRVLRVFTLSTKLTSANINTLDGYMRPASASSYGAWPLLKWYRDGTNNESVKVVVIGLNMEYQEGDKWRCTVTMMERSDS